MSSITEFLAMGGYGAFIWAAFGLTAVVLIGLLILSLRDVQEKERHLAKLQAQLGDGRRARHQ